MKRRFSIYLRLAILLVVIFLVSGCRAQQSNKEYYLLLMGESENWKLTDYEVVITPEEVNIGNGKLKMKNKDEYKTAFFSFNTYMVVNGQGYGVHASSWTGDGIDIAKKTIGTLKGGSLLNENGKPITFNDVDEIYMTVEWWDISVEKNVSERLDLYKKSDKEETLFY